MTRAAVCLALALSLCACDSCTLAEEARRLPVPVSNAAREISEATGVPVHLKIKGDLDRDKLLSDIVVVYEKKPELSEEQLARLTNMVVRKHIPNVREVTYTLPKER